MATATPPAPAETTTAAEKLATTKFTVVVHTAILLSRNPVTDKITDRVLTLGDEPELDPDDEYVARLVELKAIRPTSDVKREQAARQKVAQAQAELRALNAANVDEALAKARAEADAPELTVP